MKRLFFLAACATLMCGCAMFKCQPKGSLTGNTERPDGSFIDWRLNGASNRAPLPILLIAQGSGCAPARSNANVKLLESVFPDFASLTIEKYGVDPNLVPEDPMNGCSESYYANHTVSRRVEDAKLVMGDLRSRSIWDGRLIIFGGSEGGAVASILSHKLKEADAVVIFSTGTGLTMAEFFPMVVPPPVASQMSGVFAKARANPDSSRVIGGNSLMWWADILDRRLSEDLLKSAAPILLVHGENDRHAPVDAARVTRDAFAEAGEAGRLTYWELANRDHQMRDASGKSHLKSVFTKIAGWMRAVQLKTAGM